MINASEGPITAVHTTQKHDVLTKIEIGGKEYIYLKGVANTAANLAVTYDEAGVTALLAANAVGPVAIAQAATVASTWGWYQVKGPTTVVSNDDVADNGNVYATATAGKVDDAVVAGDRVKNAWLRGARTGAGNVAAQINYPFVDDIAD